MELAAVQIATASLKKVADTIVPASPVKAAVTSKMLAELWISMK